MEKEMVKRKEYFSLGGLKYNGEYRIGLRNGKGKEYDIKGNLIFEGDYLNNSSPS